MLRKSKTLERGKGERKREKGRRASESILCCCALPVCAHWRVVGDYGEGGNEGGREARVDLMRRGERERERRSHLSHLLLQFQHLLV